MSDPAGETPEQEVAHLRFLVDYLYEALGPANDDIMEMAEEAWKAQNP